MKIVTSQGMLGRALAAACAGLSFAAACGAAAPAARSEPQREDAAPVPIGVHQEKAEQEAKRGEIKPAPSSSADAGKAPPPRCPYGELTDPHRGFVRCLLPEERDARWLPPPSQAPEEKKPEEKKDDKKPEEKRPSGPPPAVEIAAVKFEGGGQVPKADKTLAGLAAEMGRCVADHGGLAGATGSLKVQLLVRARGKAEGVEVTAPKNVSSEAATCVQKLLKNKAMGAPTADPVGVVTTVTFKKP